MLRTAASFLARAAEMLASLERRPDPVAIPIRRNDWRGPRHGDRRH